MKSLAVVIPSKGRADIISENSLRLFPDATICVPGNEIDAYSKALSKHKRMHLIAHPPKLATLGAVRNWILENVKAHTLIMVDDDLKSLRAMAGWHARDYVDPVIIQACLENTVACAKEAGAALFGFNRSPNTQHFRPYQPIRLDSWVARVMGFIDRPELRFDDKLGLYDSIDICLQSLLKQRIIWMDCRWSFVLNSAELAAGVAERRTKEHEDDERDYLETKWGSYIRSSRGGDDIKLSTAVKRQQSIAEASLT